MLCKCTRSTTRLFALANDTKIVRSRDAQCNTEESAQGDSSILHCASLLHTIFASLACENERVHVRSQKTFSSQAR